MENTPVDDTDLQMITRKIVIIWNGIKSLATVLQLTDPRFSRTRYIITNAEIDRDTYRSMQDEKGVVPNSVCLEVYVEDRSSALSRPLEGKHLKVTPIVLVAHKYQKNGGDYIVCTSDRKTWKEFKSHQMTEVLTEVTSLMSKFL